MILPIASLRDPLARKLAFLPRAHVRVPLVQAMLLGTPDPGLVLVGMPCWPAHNLHGKDRKAQDWSKGQHSADMEHIWSDNSFN